MPHVTEALSSHSLPSVPAEARVTAPCASCPWAHAIHCESPSHPVGVAWGRSGRVWVGPQGAFLGLDAFPPAGQPWVCTNGIRREH